MLTKALVRIWHRYKKIFFVVFFFVLVLIVQLRLRECTFDDAYIHFRIARNFVQYGRPYFNPEEMVMASSSTGWTILVSGLFLLGINPLFVSIFNALATTLGAWIFSQALSSTKDALLYFVLYVGLLLPASIGLMETPVTMMLFSLAYYFYKKGHPISLLILGILPFFRLEFAVATGVLALAVIRTKKFKVSQIFGLIILGALPFLAFDLYYFHTIIPNTVFAKAAGYELDSLKTLLLIAPNLVPGVNLANIYFWVFAVPFIIVTTYLAARGQDGDERLILTSGGIIVAIYILARVYTFAWYGPLFSIPLIIPTSKVLLKSFKKVSLIALTLMITPVLFSLARNISAGLFNPKISELYTTEARVPLYIDIGEDLYKQFPDSRIMTSEIGGLGWGFNGYMLDGVGLVSPEAIQFQPGVFAKSGGIPLAYIELKKPEIIVSHAKYVVDFVESDLIEKYEKYTRRVVLDEVDGWQTIIEIQVFIRKDLLTSSS